MVCVFWKKEPRSARLSLSDKKNRSVQEFEEEFLLLREESPCCTFSKV